MNKEYNVFNEVSDHNQDFSLVTVRQSTKQKSEVISQNVTLGARMRSSSLIAALCMVPKLSNKLRHQTQRELKVKTEREERGEFKLKLLIS